MTTLPAELARPGELIDAAIAVNEAPTLVEAFQVLAEAGLSILGAPRVGVTLWEGERNGRVMATAGSALPLVGTEVPGTDALLDALRTGLPYSGLVQTAHLDPET